MATIYAAVVRQIHLEDPILQSRADIAVHLTGPLSEPQQATVLSALEDLPAKFGWVDSLSNALRDQREERQGVVVRVSDFLQLPDGTVHVMGRLFCGSLCGMFRGDTLRRVDSVWKVVDARPKAVS